MTFNINTKNLLWIDVTGSFAALLLGCWLVWFITPRFMISEIEHRLDTNGPLWFAATGSFAALLLGLLGLSHRGL